MCTEENKRLVLRWREQAYEKKNLNVIDELHGPDYVGHIVGAPGRVRGREALRQLFAAYFAAFDIHVTSDFLIAEDDMVVSRDTYRLKHVGEFQGHPADGQGRMSHSS